MTNVVVTNMDYQMHEMVTINHDGTFTIFLNARDSRERQLVSYLHAVKHIENDDFYKSDVQKIEHEAHGINYKEYKQKKYS